MNEAVVNCKGGMMEEVNFGYGSERGKIYEIWFGYCGVKRYLLKDRL